MFARSGTLLQQRFNSYFLPTILMSMALSLSIVVDGIIVGNMLGQEALAAVNLGLPLMQIYAAIFVLIGMGGSILCARHLGRHDTLAANAVYAISTATLVVMSLVCMAAGVLFAPELAALFAGGTPLAQPLGRYLLPLLWGAPFLIVTPGVSYFVRVDGHPGLASLILILANVVNLLCDVLFIYWLQDIAGAALATVTGYAAGLLLWGAFLLSRRGTLRLTAENTFRLAFLPGILRSGLPGGLSIALVFVKLFFMNMLVLSVAGKSGMIAFSVCLACLSLASMLISGASQTMMPILGVLFGEEDYEGVKIVFRRALKLLLICTCALILLLALFPHQLLTLFGIQGAEIPLGVRAVRFYAPSLLAEAFVMLMIYYFQTMGKIAIAAAVTILQNVIILLPCAWGLSRLFGLDGIWMAFSVSGACTALAIYVITCREVRRSGKTVAGLLMLPAHKPDMRALDVSIPNAVEAAVHLSAQASAFCREHGISDALSMRVGLIVEEMAVNIARYSGQKYGADTMDIRICLSPTQIRISFRDAGRPFSPLDYRNKPESPAVGGIPLIRVLGARLEYSYSLGFNSSSVILSRTEAAQGPQESP